MMVDDPTFTIRPMNVSDVAHAIRLSQAEGWNQTEKDWRMLLDNTGNVCVAAEKENRIAGTATAINHGNKIAWIGMVLVDKAFRGMGLGKMLLREIIGKLKHVESVKLDATPAGVPLYRKLGFITESTIYRMTTGSLYIPAIKSSGKNIFNIQNKDFSKINKFDKGIFGADRSYLLMNLMKNSS